LFKKSTIGITEIVTNIFISESNIIIEGF